MQYQFISDQGLMSSLVVITLLLALNTCHLWASEVTTCALCSFPLNNSDAFARIKDKSEKSNRYMGKFVTSKQKTKMSFFS